jgi:uncharacterized Fe-S cluster-containing radical SAM superfamily protein
MSVINTDVLSLRLRDRSIRPDTKQLLMARIGGSEQEDDLSEPPNCQGYGRIRHFRMQTPSPWPVNPLPMLPASHRLNLPVDYVTNAQVFQNAACNWRCWYCYVPFNLLAANERHAGWLSAEQLVGLYLAEESRPLVLDCSGGQPDLIPEWIPWMMAELRARDVADAIYLWSDDNLSNDFFWRYLTPGQLREVAGYRNYGRVCCFKGFNADSFSFNTKADAALFDRQFELFARLLTLDLDLYAYATFTATTDAGLVRDMANFVDRLQLIHRNLPLRIVPLRIENYGVVQHRVGVQQRVALAVQENAITAWNEQIEARFGEDERRVPMPSVSLCG